MKTKTFVFGFISSGYIHISKKFTIKNPAKEQLFFLLAK
jgi:hypothetical protein